MLDPMAEDERVFIRSLMDGHPRFPDGRVDYSAAIAAPVIHALCAAEGEVLVLKRSPKLRLYPSRWSGVTGFIDRDESLAATVVREIHEELGITVEIADIRIAERVDVEDRSAGRTWHVYPALVHLEKRFSPALDWENQSHQWTTPAVAQTLPAVPGFSEIIETLTMGDNRGDRWIKDK